MKRRIQFQIGHLFLLLLNQSAGACFVRRQITSHFGRFTLFFRRSFNHKVYKLQANKSKNQLHSNAWNNNIYNDYCAYQDTSFQWSFELILIHLCWVRENLLTYWMLRVMSNIKSIISYILYLYIGIRGWICKSCEMQQKWKH